VNRKEMLASLHVAAVGLSKKDILEQSSSFVFTGGRLKTYNDDLMVDLASPLSEIEAVVGADDFLRILDRLPDEEIEVSVSGEELRVKGKKREAGIACTSKVALPVGDVPKPGEWSVLEPKTMNLLRQASRSCGQDETQYINTCIHITPDGLDAGDGSRLLRIATKTGFPKEVLIPASSVASLVGMEITKVSIGKGWLHFKIRGGVISLRCSHQEYHQGLDGILKMVDPETITLPEHLGQIVERAQVFNEEAYDAKVGLLIESGKLTMTSRKDTGWYKEVKRVAYSGRSLEFDINPKFLVELLDQSGDMSIEVDHRKMKVTTKAKDPVIRTEFAVSLTAKQEAGDDDSSDGNDTSADGE